MRGGAPEPATRRRPGRAAALLFGGLLALAQVPGHAADVAPTVQQPRSFGHVVGDVLTQRIELAEGTGPIEVRTLPPAARVSAYLDRLSSRVETDRQGRRWLRLDYQVINAPRDLVQDAVPGVSLAMPSGQTLAVPAWPVSIGPLTPDAVYAKGDLQAMRPDQPAVGYPTTGARRALWRWSGWLALSLIAWLGWLAWRNRWDASHLPFARAAHEVNRLERRGQLESAEGWVSLHRAFNQAAGRVVQPESLAVLFARAPYLTPLQADIEQFFRTSSERFFARASVAPSTQLPALSRRLREAEKRGASRRGV